MTVDVEQVVRIAYRVAERKDVAGWVSLFADDGVFIDESIGVTYKELSELGKTVEVYGTAFPDMHRELYDFWIDGNTVIVRLALQGTHDEPLATPLGSASRYRQADGRAVHRHLGDRGRQDQEVRLLPGGHHRL